MGIWAVPKRDGFLASKRGFIFMANGHGGVRIGAIGESALTVTTFKIKSMLSVQRYSCAKYANRVKHSPIKYAIGLDNSRSVCYPQGQYCR